MKVLNTPLIKVFGDFALEDKTLVLGTIRATINKQLARGGGIQGSVSGDIWLLLLETLEEGKL